MRLFRVRTPDFIVQLFDRFGISIPDRFDFEIEAVGEEGS